MTVIRKTLDVLYLAAGVLAALCLVSILVLIVAQMVARWTGEIFPGAANYAGYCMAAASFFAFANPLNRGSHIRVSILLNAVPKRARLVLETWCFAVGAAVMWYFTYYAYWFVGKDRETAGERLAAALEQLAATMTANYGIYGPAFEMMENTPREPGSEEYLDSEKYQIHHHDLERPDSLKDFIARLNRLRREHAAPGYDVKGVSYKDT